MVQDRNLYQRFEAFVAKLFSLRDFAIEQIARHRSPDLLLRRGDLRLAVEIKFYRSTRMSTSLLIAAAKQAITGASELQASPCLVVSNVLTDEVRQLLVVGYEIAVYDYNDLFTLIDADVDLIEEFQSLLREGYQFEAGPLPVPLLKTSQTFSGSRIRPAPSSPEIGQGTKWCALIRAVKAGKEQSALFEQRCIDALKFLFEEDLVEWRAQLSTSSGLHRFDACARVASSHSFWLTLSAQFRTRNVVFEFKNYADPIGQAQVYSTEKYLYPSALRNTAIIVSRNGSSANAQEAARGALREHGKLILLLNLKTLCDMLSAKDSGDSPSDMLGQLLDEMLLKLDR